MARRPLVDLKDPIRFLDKDIETDLIHVLNTTAKWEDLLACMEHDASLSRHLRRFDRHQNQAEQLIHVLEGAGKKISHLVRFLQQIHLYPALKRLGIVALPDGDVMSQTIYSQDSGRELDQYVEPSTFKDILDGFKSLLSSIRTGNIIFDRQSRWFRLCLHCIGYRLSSSGYEIEYNTRYLKHHAGLSRLGFRPPLDEDETASEKELIRIEQAGEAELMTLLDMACELGLGQDVYAVSQACKINLEIRRLLSISQNHEASGQWDMVLCHAVECVNLLDTRNKLWPSWPDLEESRQKIMGLTTFYQIEDRHDTDCLVLQNLVLVSDNLLQPHAEDVCKLVKFHFWSADQELRHMAKFIAELSADSVIKSVGKLIAAEDTEFCKLSIELFEDCRPPLLFALRLYRLCVRLEAWTLAEWMMRMRFTDDTDKRLVTELLSGLQLELMNNPILPKPCVLFNGEFDDETIGYELPVRLPVVHESQSDEPWWVDVFLQRNEYRKPVQETLSPSIAASSGSTTYLPSSSFIRECNEAILMIQEREETAGEPWLENRQVARLFTTDSIRDSETYTTLFSYISVDIDNPITLEWKDLTGYCERKTNIGACVPYHCRVLTYHPIQDEWSIRSDMCRISGPLDVDQEGATSVIFAGDCGFTLQDDAVVFKIHKSRSEYALREYLADVRTQSTAAWYVRRFSKVTLDRFGVLEMLHSDCVMVYQDYLCDTILELLTRERRFPAGRAVRFDKYTSNSSYINRKVNTELLESFSHFTHEVSHGTVMVVDLQGWVTWSPEHDNIIYTLTDPVIHCPGLYYRFGGTNLGYKGMEMFFRHVHPTCNRICVYLNLTRPEKYREPAKHQFEPHTKLTCPEEYREPAKHQSEPHTELTRPEECREPVKHQSEPHTELTRPEECREPVKHQSEPHTDLTRPEECREPVKHLSEPDQTDGRKKKRRRARSARLDRSEALQFLFGFIGKPGIPVKLDLSEALKFLLGNIWKPRSGRSMSARSEAEKFVIQRTSPDVQITTEDLNEPSSHEHEDSLTSALQPRLDSANEKDQDLLQQDTDVADDAEDNHDTSSIHSPVTPDGVYYESKEQIPSQPWDVSSKDSVCSAASDQAPSIGEPQPVGSCSSDATRASDRPGTFMPEPSYPEVSIDTLSSGSTDSSETDPARKRVGTNLRTVTSEPVVVAETRSWDRTDRWTEEVVDISTEPYPPEGAVEPEEPDIPVPDTYYVQPKNVRHTAHFIADADQMPETVVRRFRIHSWLSTRPRKYRTKSTIGSQDLEGSTALLSTRIELVDADEVSEAGSMDTQLPELPDLASAETEVATGKELHSQSARSTRAPTSTDESHAAFPIPPTRRSSVLSNQSRFPISALSQTEICADELRQEGKKDSLGTDEAIDAIATITSGPSQWETPEPKTPASCPYSTQPRNERLITQSLPDADQNQMPETVVRRFRIHSWLSTRPRKYRKIITNDIGSPEDLAASDLPQTRIELVDEDEVSEAGSMDTQLPELPDLASAEEDSTTGKDVHPDSARAAAPSITDGSRALGSEQQSQSSVRSRSSDTMGPVSNLGDQPRSRALLSSHSSDNADGQSQRGCSESSGTVRVVQQAEAGVNPPSGSEWSADPTEFENSGIIRGRDEEERATIGLAHHERTPDSFMLVKTISSLQVDKASEEGDLRFKRDYGFNVDGIIGGIDCDDHRDLASIDVSKDFIIVRVRNQIFVYDIMRNNVMERTETIADGVIDIADMGGSLYCLLRTGGVVKCSVPGLERVSPTVTPPGQEQGEEYRKIATCFRTARTAILSVNGHTSRVKVYDGYWTCISSVLFPDLGSSWYLCLGGDELLLDGKVGEGEVVRPVYYVNYVRSLAAEIGMRGRDAVQTMCSTATDRDLAVTRDDFDGREFVRQFDLNFVREEVDISEQETSLLCDRVDTDTTVRQEGLPWVPAFGLEGFTFNTVISSIRTNDRAEKLMEMSDLGQVTTYYLAEHAGLVDVEAESCYKLRLPPGIKVRRFDISHDEEVVVISPDGRLRIFSSERRLLWYENLAQTAWDVVCAVNKLYILLDDGIMVYRNNNGEISECRQIHFELDGYEPKDTRIAVHEGVLYLLIPAKKQVLCMDLSSPDSSFAEFVQISHVLCRCLTVTGDGDVVVGGAWVNRRGTYRAGLTVYSSDGVPVAGWVPVESESENDTSVIDVASRRAGGLYAMTILGHLQFLENQ